MSLECNTSYFGVLEPWFFYRQHDLDIERSDKPQSLTDQCRRIGLVTLPILSYTFYHISERNPLWQALSFAMNGSRGLSFLSKLQEESTEKSQQIIWNTFQAAFSATTLVGMLIARPIGLLLSTCQDLTLNVGSLLKAHEKEDSKRMGELSAKIVISSLYLGTFFTCSAGLWLAVSSAQVCLSLYSSADELQKGNNLESGAHLLMALWRLPQLAISAYYYEDDDFDECEEC
jgi:hypothetical protein